MQAFKNSAYHYYFIRCFTDAVIEEVRSKRKQADVEIITLSDSDDESAGPPTKRSNCQSNNSSGSVSSTNNSVDMTVNVTSNLTSNVSGTSGGSSNCGRAETASPDNSNVPASGKFKFGYITVESVVLLL